MNILKSHLRAIVERVTELEFHLKGERKRLFVFEHLDYKGVPCEFWIQNWECDDITDLFNRQEQKEIQDALYEHYRCKANSED
jgi:hypothetical protein